MPRGLRRFGGQQQLAVPTYPQHIRLQMDPDERLAAALGGAVRHFADGAGLPDNAILEMQATVVGNCRRCFQLHAETGRCEIALHRLVDRLEVELSVPGNYSQAERDKLSHAGLDEVQYEVRDGYAILRLTKIIPAT